MRSIVWRQSVKKRSNSADRYRQKQTKKKTFSDDQCVSDIRFNKFKIYADEAHGRKINMRSSSLLLMYLSVPQVKE